MSSNFPLVSVIIPAYNAEAFIAQTLNSVLSQTYKNIEVLVIDDGSQDQTAKVVQSIAQADSRVTLLQQQNLGVVAARNLGIQKSCGEYIAPVDADDVWFSQKIEKQMQLILEAEPSVGLIYVWSVYIDEEGSLTKTCQISNLEEDVYIPLIYGYFLGNGSTPLIRRVCLDQVGDYNCYLQGCEDWELCLRIAKYYQFRVVQELLVGYRQVINSVSFDHRSMKKFCDLILRNVQQQHPEIPAIVYRWSSSNFNWYLALKSYQWGDHRSTLFYLYHAARLDFLPFLRPGFYRLIIISLLAIAAKPITSLIWKDHHAWLKSSKKLLGFAYQVPSVSELTRRQIRSFQQFPRKQYNQLLLRRWAQIRRKVQDCALD